MSLPPLPHICDDIGEYNAQQLRAYGQQCFVAGAAQETESVAAAIRVMTLVRTAVAAERERCAQLCEGKAEGESVFYAFACVECAATIRSAPTT